MKLVYITNARDDTNDGLSVETVVCYWKCALEILRYRNARIPRGGHRRRRPYPASVDAMKEMAPWGPISRVLLYPYRFNDRSFPDVAVGRRVEFRR